MFKIVIHGCIDGFSRRIIHLNASNNNKSKTVLSFFKSGILECGLPKRVRADKGVENVLVKQFVEKNSESTNAFITGRSVHSTRIERLWRDVNTQVVSIYKDIFQTLEETELLDENDELDILSLCYVYIPRIQKTLDEFKSQWNNHTMRTQCNRTPLQTWNINMQQQRLNVSTSILEENSEDSELEESSSGESVSLILDYPEDMQEMLRTEFNRFVPNPLSDDGSNGANHYTVLRNHLSTLVHFTGY